MTNHTLIIAEKPNAARQIAEALDLKGCPQKLRKGPMTYYLARRRRKITVVPALGHLYAVTAASGSRKAYPVFDFEWQPRYKIHKDKQTGLWIHAISELADSADEFIDACDYDIEGSVIGYNIIRYACGGKEDKAKRMRYSTLTREELVKSYEERLASLDFPWIEAGLARHEIDWLYGVNLSRALMASIRRGEKKHHTLSTGRVQGPTLKLVADREREINRFVPLPYWVIRANLKVDGNVYEALYERNVKTESDACAIAETCKRRKAIVRELTTERFSIQPPVPFNLGALQAEAFRLFKNTPKRTSDIAQQLYLNALISYPRTESQNLPQSINFREILGKLCLFSRFRKSSEELLARSSLIPREGGKRDSAHPAIYPTGKQPTRKLDSLETRILDLIIRRFFAAFGTSARCQSSKIVLDISGKNFLLEGRHILKRGWLRFYQFHSSLKEVFLPNLRESREVDVETISIQKRHSQPPPRYNPGSLLEKMEKCGIGTKATRGNIIQILYNRKYVFGTKIDVTDLGSAVNQVLEKHCPEILSTELTRRLEIRIESIKAERERREEVLNEARAFLMPLLDAMKQEEKQIGYVLSKALDRLSLEEKTIGKCPACKTGQLLVLRSKRTGKRFVGCSNHFNEKCNAAFPLPQKGSIRSYRRKCECGLPKIRTQVKNRRVWVTCLDPECYRRRLKGKNDEKRASIN